MTKEINITLEGPVTPKARARVTRQGIAFTPKGTRVYEAFVRLKAGEAMQGQGPIESPLAIDISIILPIPPSWSKTKQAMAMGGALCPASRPDLDNMVKSITDGLNGVVYKDDSQLCRITAQKLYGGQAMARISVRTIT